MRKTYIEPKTERIGIKTEDIIKTSGELNSYSFSVTSQNDGASTSWKWFEN